MSGKNGGSDTKVCPVCNANVKRARLPSHMKNVHGSMHESAKPTSKGRRAEVRKAELARRKRNRMRAIVASVIMIAAVGAGTYMLRGGASTPGPVPVQAPPPQTSSTVEILTSDLSSSAKFYGYDSNGVGMRYFAVQGADGKIHVALDACDVCYAQKKGYRQVGDVMKCNNCGKEFAIGSIGSDNVAGGCWPSYVPVDVQGDKVVLEKSNLDAKRFMF